MHLLVIVEAPAPVERATESLATVCELSRYEASSRLGGELPRIVSAVANRAQADDRVRALVAGGFDARVVPAASIEHDDVRDRVQSIDFERDGFAFTLRDGSVRRSPYGAIECIVHGVRVGSVTTTEERTVKKFNAARAVLSGGLVTRKSETQRESESHETRETFAFIYSFGEPTIALFERGIHYGFLGPSRQASSLANHRTVVNEIRRRAPSARYDDRLLRPLGLGMVPLAPPTMDTGTWKSDLGVALRLLLTTGRGSGIR